MERDRSMAVQTLKIDLYPFKTKVYMAINILGTLSEPVGDAENKDGRKAAGGFKSSRTHAYIVTSYRQGPSRVQPSTAGFTSVLEPS